MGRITNAVKDKMTEHWSGMGVEMQHDTALAMIGKAATVRMHMMRPEMMDVMDGMRRGKKMQIVGALMEHMGEDGQEAMMQAVSEHMMEKMKETIIERIKMSVVESMTGEWRSMGEDMQEEVMMSMMNKEREFMRTMMRPKMMALLEAMLNAIGKRVMEVMETDMRARMRMAMLEQLRTRWMDMNEGERNVKMLRMRREANFADVTMRPMMEHMMGEMKKKGKMMQALVD